MGTSLAPQMVCGRPSNPSLSPIRPIHRPDLTSCEFVCMPGRPIDAASGAASGAAARTCAQVERRALQVAAAAHTAAAQRVRERLERALVRRCWVRLWNRVRVALGTHERLCGMFGRVKPGQVVEGYAPRTQ